MGHVASAPPRPLGAIDAPIAVAAGGLVRRADPRARILLALVFACVIVSLSDLAALSLGLLAAVALMASARLPARRTLRRMLAMDGFMIFMIVTLPFTMPGEPFATLFGWPASWEGLMKGVEIALKGNAVILALMALVGSMDSVTFGHALRRLRAPAVFVHLLLFTVRYIEVLGEEYQRMRTAMRCRGFRPANSLHTYRAFGYLVGMMLVRAVERSERILAAMKCRGFKGALPLLDRLRFGPVDLVLGALVLSALAGLVALEISGVLETTRALAH